MADNMEMKPVDSKQGGGSVTTTEAQAREGNLLGLPGIDGGERDVEKGQPAAATATFGFEEQHTNQGNVSPLTVPGPESVEVAGAPKQKQNKDKKGPATKLRVFAQNKVYVIGTVVTVALLAATIVLAIIVSKDSKKIHTLESNQVTIRSDGYLDGFSGVFDHTVHHLAKHDSLVNNYIDSTSSTSSDTCDDDTTSPSVVSSKTADVTTTFAIATFVVNKTMTITVSTNTDTLLGIPTNTTLMITAGAMAPSSSFTIQSPLTNNTTSTIMVEPGTTASVSVAAATMSCLEWGDGAGPCTRPYGSPNSTPESVLSVMSVAATSSSEKPSSSIMSSATTTGDGTALVVSLSFPATMATPSAVGTAAVGSDTIDAASVASTSSDCVAPATTTVFITITTITTRTTKSEMTTIGSTGGVTTMTMVDTETNHVTSTIQGSSGLVTLTETLPWGNTSTITTDTTAASSVVATVNGSLTTLSVPSFTITLQSTVSTNATVTSRNSTASRSTRIGSSGAATTTAVVASSGDKVVGKPLGTTVGGHGHTGNGLYCVVMLVGIITVLLI